MPHQHFPPALLEALHALEDVMPLQEDLETTLGKISEIAVLLVAGCGSASVTLLEAGKPRTPGASEESAVALDLAQYESDSGPCLEAIDRDETIVCDDFGDEERWPQFIRSAVDHGFATSLSVPLKFDNPSGGLNLYGRSKNGLSQTPSELTELLGARASMAIKNTNVYGAGQRLIEQLNGAINTREVIGEAKGILMARQRVSDDEAFQMLVTASQESNLKLRDIATKLVREATAC